MTYLILNVYNLHYISTCKTRTGAHETVSTEMQLCLHQTRVLRCGSDLTCVGLPVNSHVNTCSSCDVMRLLKDRYAHRSTFAGNMAFCARAVPSASVRTVHDWVCLTAYLAFWSYTISKAILLFSKRCTVAASVTRVISMYTLRASQFQYSCLCLTSWQRCLLVSRVHVAVTILPS